MIHGFKIQYSSRKTQYRTFNLISQTCSGIGIALGALFCPPVTTQLAEGTEFPSLPRVTDVLTSGELQASVISIMDNKDIKVIDEARAFCHALSALCAMANDCEAEVDLKKLEKGAQKHNKALSKLLERVGEYDGKECAWKLKFSLNSVDK